MNIADYLTPYKWGKPVLTGSGTAGSFDEHAVDCPFVFRHQDKFYMMYVGFDGHGYQTGLAISDNLLDWQPLGLILRRGGGNGWDSLNAAGCWMLRENDMNGQPALKKWDNKYWLVYHAYPGDGYENGPGRIGLAWTEDPSLLTWNRLPDPILSPEDGAEWEKGGLYKECLVEHDGLFYLYYNAKNEADKSIGWIEQTGLATSPDLVNWTRAASNPLLQVTPEAWDSKFASDPCVLKHRDKWAMFFFGYDGKHAQEGIALSDDLLTWEKHPEPIVRSGPEGSLDSKHAHKPSVIRHEGILYHFYCACRPSQPGDITVNFGNEFRTIAVAASQPLTDN
ncbi:hypothetical protein [Paenibacillus sp. GCM10027626]|uniref:hypothetical protein n=1 Tax=Paenibacillus sp. GCM10027626 TaxID=3273411 RepID=UPI003637985A